MVARLIPRTSPSPRALAVVVAAAALIAGAAGLVACPEAPPLSIEVSQPSLAADGVSRAHITVHVRDAVDKAVVQFNSDGGALSSSSVPIVDQTASVELTAPLERELGRKASRAVAVVASLVLSPTARLDATATVTAVPPSSGAPLLFVDADPPAAVAGSAGTIDVVILARRVPAGTALTVSAEGAQVLDAAPLVSADGSAHARIAVPAAPADVRVTVSAPASGSGAGAASSIVVRFVAAGAPLFDLTGSFVQIGPARVKLVSGALAPNPQCATAPSLVKVTFEQTGTDVVAHYTTCDVVFPAVSSIVGNVTDRAPQSFYDAIPVVDAQFSFASGALGVAYQPPPSVVVVGASLTDPEHDALPTDENDPRVVDADHDGAPGVTVVNSLGGEQHIVFRNVGTSKGRVVSSNLVLGDDVGDLLAVTETSVFGIGGSFLPATTALGSVVELVRIDGQLGSVDADANHDGELSCAEVVDIASTVSDLDPPETAFDCAGEP